ncbi:MAG: hypothetical protein DME92_08405 [Verrucomicrobia bacterium]|nr:MAG: hypothetical protein DME92_08405 [Verrucomicrobiota bacterium]
MRQSLRFILVAAGASLALLLAGCATGKVAGGGAYHVTAYKPHDPSAARVKVSLSQENVYVMEGDRCLMAAAISVGMPNKPTPKGNFTIYSKQEHKRSGSYGFSVQGDRIVPSTGGGGGRYVGYPMGYWCEFAPAYGFHQGFVHPTPSRPPSRRMPRSARRCSEWTTRARLIQTHTSWLPRRRSKNRADHCSNSPAAGIAANA